jgi:hypothetical protein
MGARRLEPGAWDAWAAVLPDAKDAVAAQPAGGVEISVAPAPGAPARDALEPRRKRLVATASQAPCTRDAARFEERSCAAVAQQAEAPMEPVSAQAWLALKKAQEKPEVGLAVTAALVEAAMAKPRQPELAGTPVA